jgi:hypothetical protein
MNLTPSESAPTEAPLSSQRDEEFADFEFAPPAIPHTKSGGQAAAVFISSLVFGSFESCVST